MTDSEAKVYYSDWLTVDQDLVSRFAEVTRDEQFIHVDPEAAAKTPLGGTIAHGFLTLSFLTYLSSQALPPFEHPDYRAVMSMNYGFDKVRFLAPVPVGKRIRGRFEDRGWKMRGEDKVVVTYGVTIEVEESDPALVAEWLFLLQIAPKN